MYPSRSRSDQFNDWPTTGNKGMNFQAAAELKLPTKQWKQNKNTKLSENINVNKNEAMLNHGNRGHRPVQRNLKHGIAHHEIEKYNTSD